ncbi:MAG: L-rhamnose mutarotase [Ignavibacteriaceae bacterium]
MRIAFKMKLFEGNVEEYKKRHNPIWLELKEVLISHGVLSYSIFLDKETNDLFGYAEIEDLKKWKEIANTDVCKKWWVYMAPLMEVNPDNSPVSKDLKEVFHIENMDRKEG